MSKKFWTSEKLLSLAALIVSVGTLMVFIYQTNLIRKQQYMSVYPYLTFSNQGTGGLSYQYVLQNNGIGPAFIRKIKITGPGPQIYSDLVHYAEEMVQESDSIWFLHSNLYEGKLIPEGEVMILIQLAPPERIEAAGLPPNTIEGSIKLAEIMNHDSLDISLTYESIYGESWTVTNGSIPVKN